MDIFRNRRVGRGTVWQKNTINQEKQQVKDFLDKRSEPNQPKTRLRTCQTQISALEADESPVSQLRRYIFIVSALVHHERHGGLTTRQIKRYIKLAYAILRIQGVQPDSPKLGYLFGELHLVLSQIHRREGQQWEAAWEQQVAAYLSHRSSPTSPGIHKLALGLRALRLGYVDFAVAKLKYAEELGLPPASQVRARIEQVKALRLKGDLAEATRIADEGSKLEGISETEEKELAWEKMCIQIRRNGDISPLIHAVLSGKTHRDYAYILEVFLWTRAVKSRKWLKMFSTVKKLGRGLKMNPRDYGFWYDAIVAVEQCYDSEIPYLMRLKRLGELLAKTNAFFSIDKEILLWAVASRWLARNRSEGFSGLVIQEYRSKSLRLSLGLTADVLGVVPDLAAESGVEKKAA